MIFCDTATLLGRLAALVEAAAHRRAAREKSRGRRTPLLAAAARPWQPSSFCSTLLSLSLWLDVQRSSQLREEQPRGSSRRAIERGVEQRAQRRDRGAARTRGRGHTLVSGSAHRFAKVAT